MLTRPRSGAPGCQERLCRTSQGFSLIEVVLVAALAAGLFLLSIQYVVGLVDSSEGASEGSGVRREATLAVESLTSELRRASVCDPYGLDAPFREVSANRIEFYVDVNADKVLDVVAYRVVPSGESQALERAETLAALPAANATTIPPRCGQLGSPTSYTVVAPSVEELPRPGGSPANPTLPVFEPLREGKVYTPPASTTDLSCNLTTYTPHPEYCLFDGVHLQLVVRSTGRQEIPVDVDETIPVSLQGSRL